jgi:TRAP-type uncharacterized transport system fused permease subunit
MFVYGPALILKGEWHEIVIAVITGIMGTMALAASIQGWLLHKTRLVERVLLFIGALLLIKPGWITDVIGLGILIVVFSIQYVRVKQLNAKNNA